MRRGKAEGRGDVEVGGTTVLMPIALRFRETDTLTGDYLASATHAETVEQPFS